MSRVYPPCRAPNTIANNPSGTAEYSSDLRQVIATVRLHRRAFRFAHFRYDDENEKAELPHSNPAVAAAIVAAIAHLDESVGRTVWPTIILNAPRAVIVISLFAFLCFFPVTVFESCSLEKKYWVRVGTEDVLLSNVLVCTKSRMYALITVLMPALLSLGIAYMQSRQLKKAATITRAAAIEINAQLPHQESLMWEQQHNATLSSQTACGMFFCPLYKSTRSVQYPTLVLYTTGQPFKIDVERSNEKGRTRQDNGNAAESLARLNLDRVYEHIIPMPPPRKVLYPGASRPAMYQLLTVQSSCRAAR
ncbi:hypothetical protein HDU89_008934 [Geranomyces variabilis]|nr:hypothetical protein HDU89_008934 [Geranomyces variabilis]